VDNGIGCTSNVVVDTSTPLGYCCLAMKTFSLAFFQRHGRKGGLAKSANKKAASAKNGKLGGRPKGSKKVKP
jgi:hypothetical protein